MDRYRNQFAGSIPGLRSAGLPPQQPNIARAPPRMAQQVPVPPLPLPLRVNWSHQLPAFELHRIGVAFNAVSGVYIFCRETGMGRWTPLYVGEAGSLRERLSDRLQHHHQIGNILRLGATHISALVLAGDRSERLNVETFLRNVFKPACNQQ